MVREMNKSKKKREEQNKAEERAKKAKKQTDKEKAAKQAEKMAKQASKNIRQGLKVLKLFSSGHINLNQCCACFGFYEDICTGLEWLQCSCSQWIHEECVDNVVRGEDGEKKLCPLYLSAF